MTSVELVQYVKDKADIVAVIGHYLKLTKKGADYVAICPFHDDTKPSLSISPTKKIFKCFVCGTGGNCITFVQKYEHVSFMQAVKKVCNICNIDVPGLDEVVKVKPKENQDLLDAINNLTGFYHFSLRQKDGEEARSYLEKRNMNDDVINHFKIGYAPLDNTRSIKVLRERFNCSVETLEKAGILANSGSGFYDRYRDRIMFPLENTKGDIVGFSGRIYKDSDKGESKYVNSPETPIFQKSTILYNFRNAKDSVRKDGYLYVLEGFMDVIACYKAGINSAVALMGTALTEAHIALFKELGVEIRLCLDSDNAGQNAMYSTLKLFGKAKLKYKIVRKFTGAKDADEYLNAFGTDGLIDALNSLAEPIEFEAKYLVDNGKLNTLEAKDDYLQTRLIAFSRYKQLVRKDLISRLADILSINKDDLESMVDRANTFKPDDLIEDKEVKKSYASKDSLSNISTETINQNAIYDSCLKYSLSKLKDKNIITVSRLDEGKKIDDIIRAFSKLKEKDWKLYVIGDGKEYNNLNSLIDELELKDRVILTGYKNKEEIEKYNIKTYSDLTKYSDEFVFSPTLAFENREDGLPGLTKTYNMKFKAVKSMDGSLRYQALTSGKAA